MFPREWRAKPREDVDTSMIGRIWRRVMQIRGSAGVDLMARAQVRAHREPCGPRQWIPPAREGGEELGPCLRWTLDFLLFYIFEQFVPRVARQRARRNIRGSVRIYEILFRSVVSMTDSNRPISTSLCHFVLKACIIIRLKLEGTIWIFEVISKM